MGVSWVQMKVNDTWQEMSKKQPEVNKRQLRVSRQWVKVYGEQWMVSDE